MALEHLKPEVWSADLLERLNDKLVYANVCTTEFQDEITKFGDVIKINEIGTVAVNDYDGSTSALTIQTITDAQKLLNIDRSKYYAFWLDKVDRAQTKPDVLEKAKNQGAWALAKDVDEYVASLHLQSGIAVTGTWASGTAISSTNILKYISLFAQKHDEANTPMEGRWIVVAPWVYQKILMSKIVLATENKKELGQGAVGEYMNFNIYVSNNVPHGSGTDRAAVMSGYKGSIALATQILLTEGMNTVTIGFKYLLKSLMVYGAKVIRPNNLAVAYMNYTAEAT